MVLRAIGPAVLLAALTRLETEYSGAAAWVGSAAKARIVRALMAAGKAG
jgi:hypothetical protein